MANPYPNSNNTTNSSAPQIASQLQYGGDPRQAMINAILNNGGNPFTSSPIMKILLSTAPGLQAAHMLTNIGANPNDVNAMGGTGQMFGDFLKGQLSGGNIFNTLSGVSSQLPQYMNQLRDYQEQVKGGAFANGGISPFAAALEDQIGDASGMGRLMTALQAPGLGSLGQSWAGALNSGLGAKQNAMWNQFAQGGDPQNPPNFFDYVFGRG